MRLKSLLLKMDFDTERFILGVRNRPAIWDTMCPEYLDRELKIQAWNELVDDYAADEVITREDRKQLAVHLKKKWRNVRDCFVKAHKARMRSGEGAKQVQYAFYEDLLFLAGATTDRNFINIHNIKHEVMIDEDPCVVNRVLKRKKRSFDSLAESGVSGANNKKEKTQEREKDVDEDEEKLFFLSLVKEFNKVPENSRIQVKIDLLNVIKEAQFAD